MKTILNSLFGNTEQDTIIKKLETLNRAMQANTRTESEFYLQILSKL